MRTTSFCPNRAALRLMVEAAGFTIEYPQLEGRHDPDFQNGDRTLLFARPR